MRYAWAIVLLVTAAFPARAQLESRDAIALQNQILELRRDVQSLRQSGGSGAQTAPSRGDAPNDLVAALLERVSALEDQQRQLRGQVDQLRNQMQRQQEDLSKQIGDLGFQLQNSAAASRANGPAEPRQASPSLSPQPGNLAAGGPSPGPIRRTPELAMQEGNAALARRDYPAALAAAREVLAMPKTPRQVDAQFLLAQAEAGQHSYAAAAPDFYDAYSRSRTGSRAQDSLLGVASSLLALGDKRSACEALAKLRTEFPQPRGDVRDSANSVRQQAGCR